MIDIDQMECDGGRRIVFSDLLAEVKRLREQLRLAKEWVDAYASHDSLSREDFSKHIGGEEE